MIRASFAFITGLFLVIPGLTHQAYSVSSGTVAQVSAQKPLQQSGETKIYLPAVSKNYALTGRVTFHGKPVVGLNLSIQQKMSDDPISVYDSHYGLATTDVNGYYSFTQLPSLSYYDNMYIMIRFGGGLDNLSYWLCDIIDDLDTANLVCNIETSNIILLAPEYNEQVTLPAVFKWTRRVTPTDNYEIYFLQPEYGYTNLGYVSSYTITSLPYSMGTDDGYTWTIRVHGPNGYGETYGIRQVIFNNRGSPVLNE